MALMPKKTKADVKVMYGLTFAKMLGAFASIIIGFMFAQAVSKWLQIPFVIFCVITFFILSKKDKHNPNKSYYNGLIALFRFLVLPKKYETMNGTEYIRTVQKEENRLAEIERKAKEKRVKQFSAIRRKREQQLERERQLRIKKFAKLRAKRRKELEKQRKKRLKAFSKLKAKRVKEVRKERAKIQKQNKKRWEFIIKQLNKRRYEKKKQEMLELKAKIR